MKLHELKNTSRKDKKPKRLGRGIGSRGKMCGRGMKGAKARSGYKRRTGREGGQLPVFKRVPIRGFTRGAFLEDSFAINLAIIERYFEKGEVVNLESLRAKKLISKKQTPILKVLGNGELTKVLTFEVHEVSKSAEDKIAKAKGTLKLLK